MHREDSAHRLIAAALGAVLMAVSVYLPWYSLSLTANGAATVGQMSDQVAQQYGNAALQGLVHSYQSYLGKLIGTPFATASAHQALHVIGIALLVLAALALLDALFPLAGRSGPAAVLPYGAGGALPLIGLLACLLCAYRMASPPLPQNGLVSVSLREGAWLCLLGSATVLLAGLWPIFTSQRKREQKPPEDVFAQLSGWSPQA